MKQEAENFVDQFGVKPSSWIIEESNYGTTIHVHARNGRLMECHIEHADLHAAVIKLLKRQGAVVKRLEDPRKIQQQ